MARETMREPVRHIVISPRAAAATIALILLFASGAGVYWHWRYGLPPKTDDLARLHEITSEITGGMAFDSPDNALQRYRAIFVDTLGLPGATASVHRVVEGSGNPLFQDWVGARTEHTMTRLREGEWGDARHGPMIERMRAFRPILEGLDHATDAAHFRVRYSSSGDTFNPAAGPEPESLSAIQVMLPHLSLLRALDELNAAQMRIAANSGDWDDAIQRVRAGMRLAKHAAEEPFLLSALIMSSIEDDTLTELRLVLSETAPSKGAIDMLIELLESLPEPVALETRLRIEHAALAGAIRWQFEAQPGDYASAYYWSNRLSAPSPRAAMRDGARYFEELSIYASHTRAERLSLRQPEAGAASYFIASFDRTIDTEESRRTARAGTLALLRVLRFEREHGRLPRGLDEAMTTEQMTDPVTGRAFVYLVGRDGMREGDAAIDEATGVSMQRQSPRAVDAVGPRWGFTLHAPPESASYLPSVEFTQRRGAIFEPPQQTP